MSEAVAAAAPSTRCTRIGLTGGIGSGKSTVARLWAEAGAVIVDTDAIAHQLTAPGGAAMPALTAEFGPQVQDASGALDRAAMRELVFRDPQAKARLEAVLHPLIGRTALEQADGAGVQPVVFDVPLLAESRHWRQRVDRVLVVDCETSTQVRRVVQRSGWTEDAVRRVIDQQASRDRRRAIADAVLFNDGLDMAALRHQVRALWRHWVGSGQAV